MTHHFSFDDIAKLREREKYKEAFDAINQIIWDCAEQEKYADLASAHGHRSYIYKHLAQLTGKHYYALLALKNAQTQLALVEEYKIDHMRHTATFIVGKMFILTHAYPDAVKNIQESLSIYKGTNAEKADWESHLGEALYKNGKKKQGFDTMCASIGKLKKHQNEVPSFEFNVWLSGAHLRIAETLHHDDPKEAAAHLKEAEQIIAHDNRLIVRKKQLMVLKKS